MEYIYSRDRETLYNDKAVNIPDFINDSDGAVNLECGSWLEINPVCLSII